MASAYGYGRVSTGRQDISIEVQEKQCVGHYNYKLKDMGVTWGGWVRDKATSGKTAFAQRDHAGELFKILDDGDHLIFAKMDRGFRNTEDMLATVRILTARGVSVHFLDLNVDSSTSCGVMFLTIAAAVSQFERDRMGDRMREHHSGRKARGLAPTGNVPYGKRRVKLGRGRSELVWDDQMLKALRRCWELYQQHPPSEVRHRLAAEGFRNRNNNYYDEAAVCRMQRCYVDLLESGMLPESAKPEKSS